MRPPGGSNIFARRCFGHAANTSYIVFAGRISTDGVWQRERELEAFSKEMDNLRKLTEIVDAQVRCRAVLRVRLALQSALPC